MRAELSAVLIHRDGAPVGVRLERALESHPPATITDRLRWTQRGGSDGPTTMVVGRVRRPAGVAELVDGLDDCAAVLAVYDRWGTDGLGRLGGDFAALIWDDESEQLVVARAGSGSVPLYVRRGGGRTEVSTRLELLVATDDTPAVDRLRRWVELGRWDGRDTTPYEDVDAVAPGTALVVSSAGRARKRPFWTFAPFDVPRGLSLEAARGELAGAVADLIASSDPVVVADSPAGALLGTRRLSRARTIGLAEVAAAAEHPLSWSALQSVARIAGHDSNVASDIGAREALGGTTSSMQAWLRSLSGLAERSPTPKNIAVVIRHGLTVSRPLDGRPLAGALAEASAALAQRWSTSIPWKPARDRVEARFEEPGEPEVEPVTGDPFTDVRFAETQSRHLEAAHIAAARLLADRGHQLDAPFREPAVIERIFSYPPGHALADGQAMLVVGGEPVGQTAQVRSNDAPPPQAALDAADALLGGPRPVDRDA